jgi:hypothetical protein
MSLHDLLQGYEYKETLQKSKCNTHIIDLESQKYNFLNFMTLSVVHIIQ